MYSTRPMTSACRCLGMTLTFDGAARSVLGDFGLLVGIVVENTTTRKSHGAQLPLAVDLSVRPAPRPFYAAASMTFLTLCESYQQPARVLLSRVLSVKGATLSFDTPYPTPPH